MDAATTTADNNISTTLIDSNTSIGSPHGRNNSNSRHQHLYKMLNNSEEVYLIDGTTQHSQTFMCVS